MTVVSEKSVAVEKTSASYLFSIAPLRGNRVAAAAPRSGGAQVTSQRRAPVCERRPLQNRNVQHEILRNKTRAEKCERHATRRAAHERKILGLWHCAVLAGDCSATSAEHLPQNAKRICQYFDNTNKAGSTAEARSQAGGVSSRLPGHAQPVGPAGGAHGRSGAHHHRPRPGRLQRGPTKAVHTTTCRERQHALFYHAKAVETPSSPLQPRLRGQVQEARN